MQESYIPLRQVRGLVEKFSSSRCISAKISLIQKWKTGFDLRRFKEQRKKKMTEIYLLVVEKSYFFYTLLKQLSKMSYENQRYYVFVSWKNGRKATEIHEELLN